MTFNSKLGIFYGDSRFIFLFIASKYAKPFIDENDKRIICTINGAERFHGALMPDGKGDFFL